MPSHQPSQDTPEVLYETNENLSDASVMENVVAQYEKGLDVDVTPQEHEYVTGIRLGMVIAAVTAASFLMLLDTSIVATVGFLHT